MQKLNPLNDFIFQKVFGEKGSEATLLSLLNAILYPDGNDKLISVEILENKTITGEMIGDKTGILDVRAITDKGSHVNIEVQRKDYRNMNVRSPYYWSLQFAKAIKKGDDYIELPKVITINILDFNLFSIPPFHTTYHLRENTYNDFMLTDVMELHYIEMPKFRKLKEKDLNNPLHRWLKFFNRNIDDNELKELINMDTSIQQAFDKIEYLASDDEMVRLYQAREMADFDYKCGISNAKKEGKIEGKIEEKIETAKNMLKDSEPIQKIIRYTNLDEATIKQLQSELR